LVQGFILSLGSLLNDQRLSDVQWREKEIAKLPLLDRLTYFHDNDLHHRCQSNNFNFNIVIDCGFLLARSLHFAI
jgi:hypothetical protein